MKRLTMWGALVVLSACTSQSPTDNPELASQSAEVVAPVERYIVNFKAGAARDQIIAAAGGTKVMDVFGMNASAAMLPSRAVDALGKNPNVEYIEQDAKRFLMAQSTPFGIDMVQAPLVWPSATGANRKVCIIDSGIYTAHEDHQGNTFSGYPTGWNTDKCHHGTHVAGTIAAVSNTVGVVGVLPNGANIQIVKVFGDDCAWSYASSLSDAINRCVSGGSNVISMSLGGGLKSHAEQTAVTNAWNSGLIIVAAAGNDGSTKLSYPASYTNVVSVAAIDQNKVVATFSQHNAAVDIAAPGVGVVSTVGAIDTDTITVNGATYSGGHIDLTARTSGVTGALANGGLCDSVGAWSGKVVLCQRGTIDFATKVANVKSGGGIAAVIYNNVSGGFAGTIGSGSSTIAAISISMEDGQAIINGGGIGLASSVASFVTDPGSGYEAYDGTSMATPHVSAVAALVWSYNTSWTNTRVVNALLNSAQDLGTAGRDDYYGYGLVQAQSAVNYAITHP